MKSFLGIDWGGTYLKAGVVDEKGKILKRIVYSSKKLAKPKLFIERIVSLVKELSQFKIKAIGIGAPGIININQGLIYYLPNIPGWKNYSLRTTLRRKLKIPIFIDNDANVFALAESRCGAGKGKSRGIFLTLGTGLGGSVIYQGQILRESSSALELGHVPISLNKKSCGCGGKGCIEVFTGNKYLLTRYKKLKTNSKVKAVEDIYQRALKKEKEALIVWKEFSLALGSFLSGMINVFNPQVIIFGGGVSGAFKVFKPLVWQVIRKQAMWPNLQGLKLVKAKLKDAGIVGAALLAKEGISS